MPAIRTEHLIDAPPARVYAALLDFARWEAWNSTIPGLRVEGGSAALGKKVSFKIALPGMPKLPIAARITTLEHERELAWSGGVRGGLHGRHYFQLAAEAGGTKTRLVHGEDFTGALAFLMPSKIVAKITRAYADANASLARHLAES